MKIGLIGCGRVGVSMFNLLRSVNQISGVYDIDKKRERYAARLLKAKNLDPRELAEKSQAIFIATPDRSILKTYQRIKPFLKNTKYIFHFSGILGSDVFGRSRTMQLASAHPFSTFPAIIVQPPQDPYFLFCEGSNKALNALRRIFPSRYFRLVKINLRTKAIHHLSGVFASNLLIGLYLTARQCAAGSWPKHVKKDLIAEIMARTLANIQQQGPKKALSGPLTRGDHDVIIKHLNALKGKKEASQAYRALSKELLRILPVNKKYKYIARLLNSR